MIISRERQREGDEDFDATYDFISFIHHSPW